MAFCRSCGASLEEGIAFCPKCGASQSATPGATVTPAPPSAAAPTSGSTGMTNNVAAALAYFLTFITGILFLILEPYNKDKFVRFHAFQAIFFGVAVAAFWIIFSMLWTSFLFGGVGFFWVLWQIIRLIELGIFILWIFLMYKAYNKEEFKLPIIGNIAAKQAGV